MKSENLNEQEVLRLLHNDMWVDELLSKEFEFIIQALLSKKQRQILELKVQFQTNEGTLSNEEIGRLLNIKPSTIRRQIIRIKSKFRNKMELRVDNIPFKWGFYARKKNEKKKET